MCNAHLLAGQTRNARAANAFAALILFGWRYFKQLRLVNDNLRISQDTISMPKLARICTCSLCSSVELEILFRNNRSAFIYSKLGLKQRFGLVASFAPSLRSGANDATQATNKLYALRKSYDSPINLIAFLLFLTTYKIPPFDQFKLNG